MGVKEAYNKITNDYNIWDGLERGLKDWVNPEILVNAVVDAYQIIKQECPEVLEEDNE